MRVHRCGAKAGAIGACYRVAGAGNAYLGHRWQAKVAGISSRIAEAIGNNYYILAAAQVVYSGRGIATGHPQVVVGFNAVGYNGTIAAAAGVGTTGAGALNRYRWPGKRRHRCRVDMAKNNRGGKQQCKRFLHARKL